MANLIRRVALDRNQHSSNLMTFASASTDKYSAKDNANFSRRRSTDWLRSIRHSSLPFQRNLNKDEILKTEEFLVQSNTRPTSLESAQILGPGPVQLKSSGSRTSKYSDGALLEEDLEANLEPAVTRSEDLRHYEWIEDKDMPERPEPALRQGG